MFNDEYDIEKAFKSIEDELIASMMRNLSRHRAEELAEGYDWEMWQVKQLEALEQYKKKNKKKFKETFSDINNSIDDMIQIAREQGSMDQEIKILNAIKKGYRPNKRPNGHINTTGEFFKMNTRKLEALTNATKSDLKNAETAMLRQANDQYRKIIYNAQVYANTGAGTYEKAVDMATKDFLSKGIQCVEYKNGSRHSIQEYSKMAIRTTNKRAYLTGEGEKRAEWGEHLVRINKRGNACPKCLPFVGKVLIDDVWSGGSKKDGNYPLMSRAIQLGLYHPNCKDVHSTYFEGISKESEPYTKDELKKIEGDYKREQEQQYATRQAEKLGRLERFSLDPGNKKIYGARKEEWREKKRYFSGARDAIEWIERDDSAESYYKKLRNRKDDIEKISNNTGFTLKEIEQVKNHIFINEHKLRDELRRFDANYDMAVAWQRLINGSYEKQDILLLQHELLESKVEKMYNLSYDEAHEIAEKEFAWDKLIDELLGEDGENVSLDELIKKE